MTPSETLRAWLQAKEERDLTVRRCMPGRTRGVATWYEAEAYTGATNQRTTGYGETIEAAEADLVRKMGIGNAV